MTKNEFQKLLEGKKWLKQQQQQQQLQYLQEKNKADKSDEQKRHNSYDLHNSESENEIKCKKKSAQKRKHFYNDCYINSSDNDEQEYSDRE